MRNLNILFQSISTMSMKSLEFKKVLYLLTLQLTKREVSLKYHLWDPDLFSDRELTYIHSISNCLTLTLSLSFTLSLSVSFSLSHT